MKIDSLALKIADEKLIERYSNRLRKFGGDARTLGWDNQNNQYSRFEIAMKIVDFNGRKILDIGCGLADFRAFLKLKDIVPAVYAGCDINPELLGYCKNRWPMDNFYLANILVDDISDTSYDIVTLFGVLNFRFKEFDNMDFARQMISKAFTICRESVVVDFLTAVKDLKYPEEDFVYYYDPCEILKFALTLTPHVTLRHDYQSLPQREMMLVLHRHPSS
ncbi:methyltransferase domain-containing protein [Polynucleobacter alcilacus]|uniref:methyltransferase domain-containing protein n=1 Tax=Polynucleobacter alcilacus TaxID=1819739 RepID=UPI001C0ACC35|nr:class I SAM-dependent methyltransferase [Polynucleobacter alcilacus]MBU3568176.1 methyltransferase [Polynucleobacter alcilacus]